jgi:hypothetical protein
VCWPIRAKDQLSIALPKGVRGTLSLANELGGKLAQGMTPAINFLAENDRKPFQLFRGTVDNVTDDQTVINLKDDSNNSMTVIANGENMAVVDFQNRKVKAMAPDSICFVTDDGTPLSSAELNDLKNGEIVNVIGIEARPEILASTLIQLAFQNVRSKSGTQVMKRAVGISLEEFKPLRELNGNAQSRGDEETNGK